jgi:lysophospholipase L1-like esterase
MYNNIFVGAIDCNDSVTHNGGLSRCLKLIKEKNRKALILLFTSLPRFDKDGYYRKLQSYVDGQIAVCERKQIPYLNQWQLCGFNQQNFSQYYLSDKIHLNCTGYKHIGMMQMEFIRENIENKSKN